MTLPLATDTIIDPDTLPPECPRPDKKVRFRRLDGRIVGDIGIVRCYIRDRKNTIKAIVDWPEGKQTIVNPYSLEVVTRSPKIETVVLEDGREEVWHGKRRFGTVRPILMEGRTYWLRSGSLTPLNTHKEAVTQLVNDFLGL
jgi:hypothetical protein